METTIYNIILTLKSFKCATSENEFGETAHSL